MNDRSDGPVVETPVGRIDLARVRGNAARVARYAARHRLNWRPHIKTHKSRAIAAIQLSAGARGLTVATLREAEVMADVTPDLLLAYPPVGDEKLARLFALPANLDLKVALDDIAVLEPLARAAFGCGRTVGIIVEQDVGLGRVGVATPEAAVRLAAKVRDTAGVTFRGLQFYPGHIRGHEHEQANALGRLSDLVRATLAALRAEDLDPEIVSGGSTPTLWRSHDVEGLTEIRSGSCIFFDREALEVGVAEPTHLAYTVLSTVVSTAVSGQAIVDAGSKAMAKEARGGDAGYGFVLDRPEVLVSALSEEHGTLDLSRTSWRPAVGDRVLLVPNHVCVSVNLQDRLLAVEEKQSHWIELEARGRGPWAP